MAEFPLRTSILSRKRNGLLADKEKEGYIIADNLTLVKSQIYILLAVLPGQATEVMKEVKDELGTGGKILVSVVSAVSIHELKEWTGNGVDVVRLMPNTAIEYGASMTCIAGEDESSVEKVRILFEPLGQTMVIKEQLMPAATILAACGIAFFPSLYPGCFPGWDTDWVSCRGGR